MCLALVLYQHLLGELMFKILPLLALLGCASELTPLQKEIIHDYQVWIDDNSDEVQEYLVDHKTKWRHDVSDIGIQSWGSDYYQKNLQDEFTVAQAAPMSGKIYIDPRHKYWKWIEEDYLFYRDAWDDCGDDGELVMHGWDSANAAFVLCHENGHNLGIRPHKDVYSIGDACKEVRVQEISTKLRECEDDLSGN